MTDTVDSILPGEAVPLPDSGATAVVYPLGVRHLKKFGSQVATVLAIASRTPFSKGADQKDIGAKIIGAVTPYILTSGLDLLSDCVRLEPKGLTLEDLAHWELPPILESWIEQSFGEEKKWRPWLAIVETAVEKATGKRTSISEMLSSFSSRAATQEQTSSTGDSQDSLTEGGQ